MPRMSLSLVSYLSFSPLVSCLPLRHWLSNNEGKIMFKKRNQCRLQVENSEQWSFMLVWSFINRPIHPSLFLFRSSITEELYCISGTCEDTLYLGIWSDAAVFLSRTISVIFTLQLIVLQHNLQRPRSPNLVFCSSRQPCVSIHVTTLWELPCRDMKWCLTIQ